MPLETFLNLIRHRAELVEATLQLKGQDYSGERDVLQQIHQSAARLTEVFGFEVPPRLVWAVLFDKQLSALNTFLGNGALQSEPISSRLTDLHGYLYLFEALLVDENRGAK